MADQSGAVTVYEAAGGEAFFTRLVDIFYREVEADPLLLAIYPDPTDLVGARERFALFLMQYWGGPTTYDEQRGHPRLRMRHAPFVIDEAGRDHWLAAMRAALDETNPPPVLRQAFDEYFATTAEAMRNNGLKRLI
jgi:hemoglobin